MSNMPRLRRYRQPDVIDRGLVLDLPFAADLTPRKGIESPTFARNATATYFGADGLLKTAAVNQQVMEYGKYRAEQQVLYSSLYSRDLTQADWVKTDCGATKTATGLDGSANVASILTSTDVDATCLQTVTLAEAVRGFQADVKRVTGTGDVFITLDGGSSWTDITSDINSTTYTQVFVTDTVTDPVIGFKLATSGDAIAVDFANQHNSGLAASRVTTTTSAVTRYADTLSYTMSDKLKSIFSVDQGWGQIVESITAGPTINRSSYADGQAWVGFEGKNLSQYADQGYKVLLKDAAGKYARAYLGSKGSGVVDIRRHCICVCHHFWDNLQ